MDSVRAATGVADGHRALATGDWERARAAFEAALEAGGDVDAEALDGLGRALLFQGYWCLSNVAGLMRQLTEDPVAASA